MNNQGIQNFFLQPAEVYQRQYEALRAVFVEDRSQKEVAQTFNYSYQSFRQLVHQFRSATDDQRREFFFDSRQQDGPFEQTFQTNNQM